MILWWLYTAGLSHFVTYSITFSEVAFTHIFEIYAMKCSRAKGWIHLRKSECMKCSLRLLLGSTVALSGAARQGQPYQLVRRQGVGVR